MSVFVFHLKKIPGWSYLMTMPSLSILIKFPLVKSNMIPRTLNREERKLITTLILKAASQDKITTATD